MISYSQHSFTSGWLDRALMGRQDLQKYFDGVSYLENFNVNKQGYLSKRKGTSLMVSLKYFEEQPINCRLIPFSASISSGFYLLFCAFQNSNKVYVLSKDGMMMKATGSTRKSFSVSPRTTASEAPYVIAKCNYQSNEIDELSYAQSGDTIFLTHRKHPVAKIYRKSNNDFIYEVINITTLGFKELPQSPTNVTLEKKAFQNTDTSRTIWYKVTAVIDDVESAPSKATSIEIPVPWQQSAKMIIRWDPVPGAEYYNVYKKESSEYGLIGTTRDDNDPELLDLEIATPPETEEPDPEEDEEEATAASRVVNGELRCWIEDNYIQPDVEQTPPRYEEHFNKAGDFPSCSAFYQQRFALASTDNAPFNFWLSTTGDFYNFNEHVSMREDDAIEATLPATEFPSINHMLLSRDLILFCENGIWVVAPSNGAEISYKTIMCRKQNSLGTAKSIQPIYCIDHIISVDVDRRTIRGCKYSFSSDALEMKELTSYATDIFKDHGGVWRMAWQQNPNGMLWVVLDDGTLATMTYMPEQNVCSFAHQTFGKTIVVKDVASNKSQIAESGCDHVAYLVETPNGIEVFQSLGDDNDFCLDGKYGFTGTSSEIEAEMLANNKGAEDFVAIYEDGTIISVNEDGTIENREQLKHGFVQMGYSIISRMTTVYPQASDASSQQFNIHNLKKASFRLFDSSPFYVVAQALYDARDKWQKVHANVKYEDGKMKLFTGDISEIPAGVNSRDGRVCIIHDSPYPFNLTYLSLKYSYDPQEGGEG